MNNKISDKYNKEYFEIKKHCIDSANNIIVIKGFIPHNQDDFVNGTYVKTSNDCAKFIFNVSK